MKYSKGMSLVEILLAVALAAFFVMSASMYLYSLHPNNLLKDILGGDVKKEWIHPKMWKEKDIYTNSSVTYIADEELQGQRSCKDFDISNLKTRYFTSQELGIGTTSIPTGVKMIGNILYVSLNSSSTTDPDLVLYRSEREHLTKVSSLNTGPGASDMAAAGLTVFLANTSVNSQAQMIDVSNELNPRLVRSYIIPGSNSVTSPISKKIFVYKNLLYVGTEKSTLPELYSFDIKTGIAHSFINTEYGINGLYVRDGKLYVLSPKDPELEIFNIDTMEKVDAFDAPQSLGNGRSIYMSGEHMFFGRSRGDNELYDIPKNIFTHIGASVDHILSTLDTVYIFTSSPQERVKSFDTSLILKSKLSLAERISSVVCTDDGFFLALQSTSTPLVKLTEQL